jgi:glycosyltransferase involved in cell wall biosynthesis
MNGYGPALDPRISVVIPVFNRERTIGRAIASALAQSRPPAEIVVVDDGSTDGTAGVVAAFGDRVRYVFQPNAGASAARNHGVKRASAPWIAFLDSDDHWLDDHLARMAEAIAATGGVAGFYFGDCRRPAAEAGASLWEMGGFATPDGHCLVDDATDWVLMDLQPTMLQSSVFARDRYLAAGGLWPALRTRHDTHLYFVMGIGGPACAVAHGGVQMTSDDESGHRLTEEFGPATRDWWLQTRLMYADVLRRFPHLAGDHRRRVRTRLATAHLRLGQDAWRKSHVGPAASHLARATRVAPRHLTASAVRRLGRSFSRRVAVPGPGGVLRTGEAVR